LALAARNQAPRTGQQLAPAIEEPLAEPSATWVAVEEKQRGHLGVKRREQARVGSQREAADASWHRALARAGITDRTAEIGTAFGDNDRLSALVASKIDADLLILDEPAASLDPQGRHDVLDVMERLRKHTTIFYSTHILDDVQRVSDTVVILNRGELVAQGPIEEMLAWGQAVSFTLTVKGDSTGVETRLRSQPWVTGLEEMSRNGRVSWRIQVSDRKLAEAELVPLALADGGVTICEFGCKTQILRMYS
jgi:ABC-type multidrug transport system ATPase subunit